MARVAIIGASIGGLPAAYESSGAVGQESHGDGDFECRVVPLRAVESLGGGRLAHPERH